MKNKILLFIFITLTGFISIKVMEYSALAADIIQPSGKWVAEYGGSSTPFRCTCCNSFWRSQCTVGDTTSDLKKCE